MLTMIGLSQPAICIMQDGGLVSEVDDYQVWAGYGAINSTNERDYKFSD